MFNGKFSKQNMHGKLSIHVELSAWLGQEMFLCLLLAYIDTRFILICVKKGCQWIQSKDLAKPDSSMI